MSQPGKIFALIPKIMSEIGSIEKTRKNIKQNYTFRGIDDVYFALQPLLSKHGVFYVPEVVSRTREERKTKDGLSALIYTIIEVQFTFFADDGSSVHATTIGEGMDSGDKSANKAQSAALKVAMLQIFCVPTEGDNDTENHSPEIMPVREFAATNEFTDPHSCTNPIHNHRPGKKNPNVTYCHTCWSYKRDQEKRGNL